MLTDKKVKAFVVAADAAAARKFYTETLGFKCLGEDSYGLEFEMQHALLRVIITDTNNAAPRDYTVLGWDVPDIYEAVRSLKRRGIVFERYSFLQQDNHDVWQAPGGTRIAWFKDPNGNVLSIGQ